VIVPIGAKIRSRDGVLQESPGRQPWEQEQAKVSALKGRRRLLRPFRAGLQDIHAPRACALGFLLAMTRVRGSQESPSPLTRKATGLIRPSPDSPDERLLEEALAGKYGVRR